MGTDQEGAVRCGELADNFEANAVVGVGNGMRVLSMQSAYLFLSFVLFLQEFL